MRYRLITPGELDPGLMAAWQALQAGSEAYASPYFCAQFTHMVGALRPDARVVVAEDGARPVAFFAYQRTALGFGRPIGGSLSDYHGVLGAAEADWQVPELMRAARLMTWKFDHLADPWGKFEPFIKVRARSPQIDVSQGVAACRKGGSDLLRDTRRKARKLAREQGEVVFALHDTRADVLEFLFRWKSAQYRRSGLTDPFQFPWVRELLRRIAQVQCADFAGVASSLRVGEKLVAVHLGMRSRRVLHHWFPAHDPAYARYSAGIVLLLEMVRAAGAAGLRTLDLGRGEPAFKQRVMTGSAPLGEGSFERSALFGSLARVRDAAVSAIRRIQAVRPGSRMADA